MMKDQVSALMDGELGGEEADAALALIRESQELRRDWVAYHLIGDFLRSAPPSSHDFVDRFAERLAQEPTVVAATYQMSVLAEVPVATAMRVGNSRTTGGNNN